MDDKGACAAPLFLSDSVNLAPSSNVGFTPALTGRLGESDGCITLTHPTQFEQLRAFLHSQKTEKIPGTDLIYYGKVIVQ